MKQYKSEPNFSADWPMLGHDPGNCFSDGSNLLPPLQKAWEFKAGGGIYCSPVPAYGMVFFVCKDKYLYALNSNNGQLNWKIEIGEPVESFPPVVACGTVYITTQQNNLYAIESQTGRKIWQFATGKARSLPAVADGKCFLGSADGVMALDATDGRILWQLETPDFPYYDNPVVVGEKLLIKAFHVEKVISAFFAVDTSNGRLLWKCQLPDLASRNVRSAIANDCIFYTTPTSINVLDLNNGKNLDSIMTWEGNAGKPSSLGTNGEWMFVGIALGDIGFTDFFHVFNLRNGNSFNVNLHRVVFNQPLFNGKFMVIADDMKGLIGVNLQKLTRRLETKPSLNRNRTPVMAGGMVFAVAETFPMPKGKILAFKGVDVELSRDSTEMTGVITDKPVFEAIASGRRFILPNACCLCFGTPEEVDQISINDPARVINYLGIPYCKNCYKKIHGGGEKPGVIFFGNSRTLLFRNEKYWSMFMELNSIR